MKKLILLVMVALLATTVQATNLLTNPGFETDSTPGDVYDAPDGWLYYVNYNSQQYGYLPRTGINQFYMVNTAELAQAIPQVVQDGDILTFSTYCFNLGATIDIGHLEIRDWANNIIAQSADFKNAGNYYMLGVPDAWTLFTASVNVGSLTPSQKATVIGGYATAVIVGLPQLSYAAYIDDCDFTITSIPEPATMVLLGLGGLILRRRSA